MAPSCITGIYCFSTPLLFRACYKAKKLAKLKEVVGESREGEEDPEGEVVVGPSREAVVYSSDNTPLLFFQQIISSTILFSIIG